MPANKHKRKASAQKKSRAVKNVSASGLITLHPKFFISVGLLLVAIGLYIMAFKAQSDAMFGIAMLSLVTGTATTIYANFATVKKN